MLDRHRSIQAGTLVDGRFRLESIIHRTATAIVYDATHRNGSRAWLKMAAAEANGPGISLEASFANVIPSALTVRDDGLDDDGLPFLVLDPIDAESLETLQTRGRNGEQLTLSQVLAIGDALIGAAQAIDQAGYAMVSLDPAEVLVLASGDVALLALDRVAARTEASRQQAIVRLRFVLRLLLAHCTDIHESAAATSVLDQSENAVDIDAVRAAWRAASPEPLPEPRRAVERSGPWSSVPDGSTALAALPVEQRQSDRVAYLRSPRADLPSSATIPLREMYDPISRIPERPRLVQAMVQRGPGPVRERSRRTLVVIAAVALSTLGAGAVVAVVARPRTDARGVAVEAAIGARTDPSRAPVEPPSPPALELDDEVAPAAAPSVSGLLRTQGAPAGRRVYIDEKLLGQTPLAVEVACGEHRVQVGSRTDRRPIEVPCGGELVLRFEPNGRWTAE